MKLAIHRKGSTETDVVIPAKTGIQNQVLEVRRILVERLQPLKTMNVCLLLLTILGFSGCLVGPDFQPPQTPVPAAWAGTDPNTAQPIDPGIVRWWTVFQDPILTSLVKRATESNLDLQVAESRIRQARAAKAMAVSGLAPTIDAVGSFRRSQSAASNNRTPRPTTNLYQVGFDAAWELDIFGGVRRNIEAFDADLAAAVETRRDVWVTLTSDVARNYIELRTFQQQVVITGQNLAAQKRTAELTRKRREGGLDSTLDVANAEALVATTAAQIPSLEQSARISIYSLSVLLGQDPAALMDELSPTQTIPAAPPSVPLGIPSDLLRRRPDIRAAEARIHAATARIGVATADLYPRFQITSSIGYQSDKADALFNSFRRFWTLGPTATWRVFDMGNIGANIELQKALEEESFIMYRQTVLSALQEVENALISSEKEQQRYQALTDAVTANRKAVDLSTLLYTQGQTDFLNVLVAQRALANAEDAQVQSAGTLSTNLIALYKALGGDPEPETQ
jgi:outer membrane protein, multidrug efflux system